MTYLQIEIAREIAFKHGLRAGFVMEQAEALAEDPDSRMTIDMALRFLAWSYDQDQIGE